MIGSRPRRVALAASALGLLVLAPPASAAITLKTPPRVDATIAFPERTGTAQLYQQAYDPATGLLYVADTGNARVNVVYTAKATQASTGGRYVTEGPTPGAKVDPKPNTIVKRIPLGSLRGESIEPYGLGIDASTHKVYATATRDERLVIVQGNDGTPAGSTGELVRSVPVGAQARDIAVDPKTHRVYVSQVSDALVSEHDGTTGRVLRTFDATGGDARVASTAGLTANWDQGVLYAANLYSNGEDRSKPGAVSVIDVASGETEQTIATGGRRATRVAYDGTRHRLFVANQGSIATDAIPGQLGSVTSFDVDTTGDDAGELALVRDTPTTQGALDVAVDEGKGFVYSTDFGATDAKTPGTVTVLSADSGAKVTALKVGAKPLDIVVDQASHRAYVTNQADATISVIDASGAEPKVAETFKQPIRTDEYNVYQSAYNPKTGLLYVADPGAQRIRVIYTAQATRDSTNGRYVVEPRGGGKASDPAPNSVVKSIDVPVGGTFDAVLGLAINTKTNTLYGSTPTADGTFYVIDGRTDAIKITLKLGEKGATREIRVDEATNTVYATQAEAGKIAVIDGDTNKLARALTVAPSVATANFPAGLSLNLARGLVYVVTPNFALEPGSPVVDGAVHVIELASGKTVQTVDIGQRTSVNVAFDAAGSQLFVASQGPVDFTRTPNFSDTPGSVATYAIDPATGRIGERKRLQPTAIGALGLTIDAPRGVVYSTDYGLDKPDARTVSILSERTGEKLGSLQVGFKPLGVTVAPESGVAYVTNQKDASVSVVSPGEVVGEPAGGATGTLPEPKWLGWKGRTSLRLRLDAGTVRDVAVTVKTADGVALAEPRTVSGLGADAQTVTLTLTPAGRALGWRKVASSVQVTVTAAGGAAAARTTAVRLSAR